MKHLNIIRKVALLASACVLAFALAACAPLSGQGDETAQAKSANRQYIAQLNHQMADLQQIMDDFQVAVSQQDTVAMQTQIDKAGQLVSDIDSSNPTDQLSDVKGRYVDALTTLNGAMKDYASLYEGVQSGTVSSDDLASRLSDVQSAYDDGVSKLKDADDALTALAQG